MSLVLREVADRPQTHAIVIGVGAYPHLLGGAGPPARDSFGLRQLSSPPVSARAVTDWLLTDFNNRDAPVGTVELLLSELGAPVPYANPRTRQESRVEVPAMWVMKQAIRAWKQRADSHLDNIALFYFCGHGLAKGEELALLASDFGDPGAAIMENAVDFNALLLGMEGCRARKQCYFVDACRNEPARLRELQAMGDNQILDPSIAIIHTPDRDYPVFYATARDYQAHALAGQVSRFTDALLCALRGAGCDDSSGSWVVNTYSLLSGIKASLDLGNRRRGVPQQRAKSGNGNDAGFDLHRLRDEPRVPVVIGCQPPTANAVGNLALVRAGAEWRYGPDEEGWHVELATGAYELLLHFQGSGYRDARDALNVRPPYREKLVPVQS